MKLLSTFCLLSLAAGGLHAQIALDSGLVAHWELDDNVLDSSPNFHNGTAMGPIAIDDRFGNPSSAYSFNGTTDYIALPTLWPTPPDAVTFSCWFKSSTTNPQGKLILHGDNGEFQMYTEGNQLTVAVHLGTNLPTGWLWASEKFVDDNWHFAAGRYQYGQLLELYFDGGVVKDTVAPAVAMMDPGPNFPAALGKYVYNNFQYYTGFLDDVRIYDRALSNAELDSLSGNRASSVPQHETATGLELFQNQPNPTNGTTTLSFNQPTAGPVSLRIYDLNGRLLTEVENGTVSAGTHSYSVDLSNVGAGVYLYELRSAGSVLTRKLLVE